MKATATADYAPWEVGAIFVFAAACQVGALLLLHLGQKNVVSDLPEIDKGAEMPVKVQPVLDLEGVALKLGGKKPVLPDMWQAPKPPAPAQAKAPDQAFASTKADEKEAPEKSKPMAEADAGPPPPDAGDKEVPDASTEPSDAGTTEPTDKPEGNKQEGVDGGVSDGKSTDASERNQKATYAARIGAFLASIGRRGCAGGKGTVVGSVTLSGGTITAVNMSPSDSPDLAGVGPAMQGAVGQQIPPPPDDHPDWAPSAFAVTINCK